MHDLSVLITLAGALAVALVLGFLAHRLKLSPIVGYLLAGVAVGPFTPGFVAHQAVAEQFAEIGVILLLFGIGLRFQPERTGCGVARGRAGGADSEHDVHGRAGGGPCGCWAGVGPRESFWGWRSRSPVRS